MEGIEIVICTLIVLNILVISIVSMFAFQRASKDDAYHKTAKPSNQVIRQHTQKEYVTNYFNENCKVCELYTECEKLIRKTDMHGNSVTLCDVINDRL